MTDKARKMSLGRYKRRRRLIQRHMHHAVDRDKMNRILDYGSRVQELDLDFDVERLYLISAMAMHLSNLALDMDEMDLAFMLEVINRTAEESLGEALGL